MRPTRNVPRRRLQVINSPMKEPGKKLTRDDIIRLNDKRAELILVLREWHGYGHARAETEINIWLRDHS